MGREETTYIDYPAVAIVIFEDKKKEKFYSYPIYFENGQMNDLYFDQGEIEDEYTIIPAPRGTIARVYSDGRAEEIYYCPE